MTHGTMMILIPQPMVFPAPRVPWDTPLPVSSGDSYAMAAYAIILMAHSSTDGVAPQCPLGHALARVRVEGDLSTPGVVGDALARPGRVGRGETGERRRGMMMIGRGGWSRLEGKSRHGSPCLCRG